MLFVFGFHARRGQPRTAAGSGRYLMAMVLRPLKQERVEHIAGALVCLAISLLAIVASILTALPILLEIVRSG
jgi:hypothetical protein